MDVAWPLVGRTAHLDRLRALLRAGAPGVVLAGAAGVGKTRLADECLTMAKHLGFAPVRASATQAAASLPLGAFAPLLSDIVPGVDRTEILWQVSRAIAARGEDKPVALFVDDVHLLDDVSAALVHQLVREPRLFLLATLRSEEPAPDAVLAIWKDGLAPRLDLEPLTETDVDELLSRVLGGSVDRSAVRLFWARSTGNALFLRELVRAAVETGCLRGDDGLWRLHGPLPASARLLELIEARLAGLDPSQRETLQLLAFGQPLGVEMLQHLGGSTLEALEGRGLIMSERDGRRLAVRLAHPLYAELLRGRLTPLRTRALSRALADALETTGHRRRDDGLRLATWRLEGGGDFQAATILDEARRARVLFELELAERLARAAIEADPTFDGRMLLAELLIMQGRYDEADQALAALAAAAKDGDDTQRTALALTRIYNSGLAGRPAKTMTALLEAEAEITDPRGRDQLAIVRAGFAFIGGFTQVAADLVEPLLSRATGPALAMACATAVQAFGLQGRLGDALLAADRGLAAHKTEGATLLMWHPSFTLMGAVRARIWAGELTEAEAIAMTAYEEALGQESVEAQGYYSSVIAQGRLVRGDVTAALRWAQQGVTIARGLSRFYFARAAQQLIEAWALAGEPDEAAGVLAELEATTEELFKWEAAEVERARGWIAVARNEMAEARQLLAQSAAIAARSGDHVLESAALHDLARFGRAADVTHRLAELGAIIEGPLAPVRAAHAAALAENDPLRLEEAAAAFETNGVILFAAEAMAEAAVAWRRTGAPRKAVAAEQRASGLAARCEGARTPGLMTTIATRAVLSARELEIARLAASGIANKDIAARLCLSVHTIENRLHTVYEKLGVSGRAGLRRSLDGH